MLSVLMGIPLPFMLLTVAGGLGVEESLLSLLSVEGLMVKEGVGICCCCGCCCWPLREAV
jgi:hypothetical protein